MEAAGPERDADGLPTAWVERMTRAVSSTIWRFSTSRMLEQYVEELYLPAAQGMDTAVPVAAGWTAA